MKNWWDILEVERDVDLRSVKRAYAAKLKTIRQDEDPQGFMEVRAAYDEAQNEIRFREAYPEEWQKQFEPDIDDVDQDVPNQSAPEAQAQENTELDNLEVADDVPATSLPTLPNEHYSPIVMQLVGEVEALMKSPWGVGSVESWTALLDDSRLDDIDVFSDFENAMLNYLLNIHAFHDEDANIPSKLGPAIAYVLFDRFGWQEKRNSVHINPMVFDWLAVKLFKPNKMDLSSGGMNTASTNIELQHTDYAQNDYARKSQRKPTPRQDKFTQWFDGVGKLVLIGSVVLIFIAAIISGQ